jgi:hypothetical protein
MQTPTLPRKINLQINPQIQSCFENILKFESESQKRADVRVNKP